ncbi:MAG: type II toxin-antitoxin system RelE/ParE family toxin [Halobacteria archaeon]|nr:type II toxin-antitoxin system RelE/ParE family toxin [Halobacteria archaeon]
MSYRVLLGEQPREFLSDLDDKSEHIVKENLEKLGENPYPGEGKGDKEKLPVDGRVMYRLHIGRTYTAFYTIADDEVRVREILPIDDAHKKYGA